MDRCTKTKRQIARQTSRERMMEMEKKREKEERQKTGGDGETPVGWIPFGINSYTVFASWKLVSEQTEKFQKNPTSSVTAMVLWSSGSEKDGLVHFYCLANAPNSPVCSSIIHSVLLFPSKLPPRPFFSPSKFSPSLSHSSFVLSVLHCQSSEPWSTSWDTLKMNGHGSSHRILS